MMLPRLRRTFPPLHPEQQQHLAARITRTVAERPQYQRLVDCLLALGGLQVVLPHIEEDFDRLMMRGVAYGGGYRALRVTGAPCSCHSNAGRLWNRSRLYRIVTGYALSADGLWRQHSWCLRKTRIVETTTCRVRYYGYELTDAESAQWCEDNW